METLKDFLGNDKTGVYHYSPEYRNLFNSSFAGSFEVYSHPYLSFGDYDKSCHIERSNVRVFLDRFKGSFGRKAEQNEKAPTKQESAEKGKNVTLVSEFIRHGLRDRQSQGRAGHRVGGIRPRRHRTDVGPRAGGEGISNV